MVAPGLPMSGVHADDTIFSTIRDGFASHTMTFNTKAQRQSDEISNLKAVMMEMRAAHQQQLHRMEVNMAHILHNAGGSTSVPTIISTMIQAAPAPALA